MAGHVNDCATRLNHSLGHSHYLLNVCESGQKCESTKACTTKENCNHQLRVHIGTVLPFPPVQELSKRHLACLLWV